jgi:glycosyltransferase involved in cell wall biosynthesis
LLESISILKNENIQVKLIVAGEFWEDIRYYQELITHWKIQDRATIDNRYIPDEEADLLFSAADILVAPYTAGTQSAAAALGMAYGLPLIVTEQIALGINRENTPFSQVVPPADSTAIALAARHLIEDLDKIHSYTENSASDWSGMVEALVNLTETPHV